MMMTVLGLSALTLAAALCLFVTLKRELWQRAKAAAVSESAASASLANMRSEIDDLRKAFNDLEERTGMLAAPPPVRSGLNMGRRSHAARMLRRGDTAEQVAAGMGLPLNEAKLLLTVERLRASDPDRHTAAQ